MSSERTDSRQERAEPDEPVAHRIERAHRQIREFLDREVKSSEDLNRTRALLDTLPRILLEHFAEEEGPNGLYEALRERRPALEPELKFLLRQHREILGAVEDLERQVREMDEQTQAEWRDLHLARIREGTAHLMGMVRRHEQAESRLVADVLYTEDGGSG